MLNEIFKGMDNAAEVINENFQSTGIIEHNLNIDNPENGYYVRYGSGFQVCWNANFVISTPSGGVSLINAWNFPKEFSTNPAILGSTLENPAVPHRSLSPNFLERTGASVTVNMSRMTGTTDFAPGDSRPLSLIAIGLWK